DEIARGPALALADPSGHPERGRLPHGREEARSVVDRWGGTLLSDSAATKSALKKSLEAHPALIHFATHAEVDRRTPRRSALLLSPSGDDDGFLRAGEIDSMGVNGSVLLLSACRTAHGRLLSGEGAQSLARS